MKTITPALHFAKTLTLRKVLNGVKVLASYYFSRYTGKPSQWGLPVSIAIEPTTACNLGCPECPSGLKQFSRPTGNLKSDFFRNCIDQLYRSTTYLTFYFQGEPYINPSFLDMVRYAVDRGMYTSTSTNGHFLNPKSAEKTIRSGLQRIIISVDGTTQEVYEQYRVHGSLQKVIEGTKNLVDAKKRLNSPTPHIIYQFLVVKPNEHQADDIRKMAAELGVDEVRYKTAQVYDYKDGNPLIPENSTYSRYQKLKDGTYRLKNKMVNHCWRLWNSCVITWDGKVVPCCFDKDASHQLGDLGTDTFASIWQNLNYKNFRKSLLTSRKSIDICSNCSEGTKVWVE
ncbi:MAG: radical SAM/SPASM domain-containing protein [Bacteroidota bacterium]